MGFVQFRAIKTNTQSLNQPDSEEFCPKTLFFKDKTHNNDRNFDIFFKFFFGTLCSNRLFPKKYLKFFVEKTFEKAQQILRLWKIGQSIDIEDW